MTTLHYDPRTRRTLAGPLMGLDIEDAVGFEVASHLATRPGVSVRVTDTVTRPWWRLWRRTPAKVLILQEREP